MYQVIFEPDAEDDIDKLDSSIREIVIRKIEWLSKNTENIAHHQLTSMPEYLKGLCRIHSGDWRVLYWISHEKRKIWIFRIEHRSRVYKKL
ncbi:MAG: type II toxin-antitoxin system RelE/ParE family toxin [Elusimicrobiota bacterium]|nr:type II toxin-antitoxin system RelE/ParE family toxin [Elusimicrobiota bacterium]